MEPHPDRFRMESADAAAWLQAVGRPRGRLGRGCNDRTRASCSPWTCWNTSQLAIRLSYRNARATKLRRTASGRWCQALPWRRQRLLAPTSDSAADDRICAVGFTIGPGDVDLRKVLQLDRQQRLSRGRAVAGPDAGRHFTLLVHKHRGIVGTDLLGEQRLLIFGKQAHLACGRNRLP